MSRQYLFEDLAAGDLEDLVRNFVEIDAHKARIDDSNIVITFYVDDVQPAQDLSRFIEFSSRHVLDTEVSSIPLDDGNYAVYVEITPTNKAKKIFDILSAVGHLCDIQTWTYKAYGKRGKLKVS